MGIIDGSTNGEGVTILAKGSGCYNPPDPDDEDHSLKESCPSAHGVFRMNSWPGDMDGGSLKSAMLVLKDGRQFSGYSFGYENSVSGEVVFNTGMVGYPESLTDPSYQGQILVITYPVVGNYGIPDDSQDEYNVPYVFEGNRVHVTALVVADYSFNISHYTATRTLAEWLIEQKVPGIAGIDTRAVTRHIRQYGSMLGKVIIFDEASTIEPRLLSSSSSSSFSCHASFIFKDPNDRNLVAQVSHNEIREYVSNPFNVKSTTTTTKSRRRIFDSMQKLLSDHAISTTNKLSTTPPAFTILAVDCGMKFNIIRNFLYHIPYKITFKVVPWDYDFSDDLFDGLFLSNGPGDPTKCLNIVQNIRKVMQRGKPIFGICLGNQLLALAAGAKTYKMKFGNRGMNQPVIDLRTSRCYITSQNHGYAVDPATLPSEWMQFFVNANDQSNEGIIHNINPWFSVQFHPEAAAGPTDTVFLFADFIRSLVKPSFIPVSMVNLQFPTMSHKVLLLGSGGLSIGQAGEFDYSGSQAIKALKESNASVILINPNIATVQTSPGLADKLYFLPVTPEFVEKVIQKERPDSILCTFGGQTALNCAVELHHKGVLAKYDVSVLGTPIDVIVATEDRNKFAAKLHEIGETCAESYPAENLQDCQIAATKIGYPVLIRAAFALGGLGSGFAANEQELVQICKEAFSHSSQVFIDKSLKGWKEIEYEVMRDSRDNCIAVCNMENFDPLGIHTGDSIVVAPSQTLTNEEYYLLRETAIRVIRYLGVVGECNIQYAVDPRSHNYCIVEVNARLSRSSALASKATGYPLAYVAAKLALGHDLVQVRNCVTRSTTACFEPSLDYVVTKVPRWDLSKFSTVNQSMGSAMKSVGEVMAVGRTFEESFQKALRMVEERAIGFDHRTMGYLEDAVAVEAELRDPSPKRIWALSQALEMGFTVDKLHNITSIDRWFLAKLANINDLKERLKGLTLKSVTAPIMLHLKKYGFADKQIAQLLPEPTTEGIVRSLRQQLGVLPFVKQIDTLAAEYPAQTNYLYLTYLGCEHDVSSLSVGHQRDGEGTSRGTSPLGSPRPLQSQGSAGGGSTGGRSGGLWSPRKPLERSKYEVSSLTEFSAATWGRREVYANADCPIMVLGCGCYRIGSSVEFDWSAMSCVRTLRSLGYKAIVVNCNPETVSTDYDESDRLYFEELSFETVMDIWEFEKSEGMIISVGGQQPNNLAWSLRNYGVNILGTSVDSIDKCEDRNKFSTLCDALKIDQPAWEAFTSLDAALDFCDRVSYPVLVRPSYVLSGASMRVAPDKTQLHHFLKDAAHVSREHPVVISKYIENAKEVEMDSVACEGQILNYAISEHVENAGVHSGDASLILPAQKLYVETIRRVRKLSQRVAKALCISGPFNIQFVCRQNEVKIIECNLRASRTFPFISKTFNVNFIEQATRVMVGAPVRTVNVQLLDINFVGVKVPMFSFTRLQGADPILGVEMKSTGEVACFGTNKFEAFLKSMLSAGFKLPERSILLSTGPLWAKVEFEPYARLLFQLGFILYMTQGTYNFLMQQWFDMESEGEGDSLTKRYNSEVGGGIATPLRHHVHDASPPLGSKSQTNGFLMKEGDRRLGNCDNIIKVEKPLSFKKPNALELIEKGKVDFVINVPESMDRKSLTNGYMIRRVAVNHSVPLITDIKVASLFVDALERKNYKESQSKSFWEIKSWDEYMA